MALVVKTPSANTGDIRDVGLLPGSGISPGERHGNRSSILAWRIPWTEEPGGLQSIVKVKSLSPVRLFVTPWTVAHQAPSSKGFSRQEYWSGLPFPSPGDLPNPGIEPRSPSLQADALTSEPPGKPKRYMRPTWGSNPRTWD